MEYKFRESGIQLSGYNKKELYHWESEDEVKGYETKDIHKWEPEDLDDEKELTPRVKYTTIIQEEEFLD